MKFHKKISRNKLISANKDNKKAAAIARLKYIESCKSGIQRKKIGKGFVYFLKEKKITNKTILDRIKKLAIPPSWSDVWICPSANGHIQATGLDLNKRKQYRYHESWNLLRNETKFHRLYEFGKVLPNLRVKANNDLRENELTQKKVLAAVVKIMERTYIRVGNNGYEKLYGSYGLTTLKDRHIAINKDQVLFSFIGKKKISHEVVLRDRRLAKIVKQCRDIPGKQLFQYYTKDNKRRKIDSGMVNSYIRHCTREDYSAKDFRTWAGSVKALDSLKKQGPAESASDNKKNVLTMLDEVSKELGNTRNVCKKYYIHPAIITLYEKNELLPCLEKYDSSAKPKQNLTASEQLLMHFLSRCLNNQS